MPARSVFISYSRADAAFVMTMKTRLVRAGYEVLDKASLTAGPVARQLELRIAAADAFILIFSENAYDSDWIEWEIQTARQREKREGITLLCPIQLDQSWHDAPWSPTLKAPITANEVVDFSQEFERPFQLLCAGLERWYGPESIDQPRAASGSEPSSGIQPDSFSSKLKPRGDAESSADDSAPQNSSGFQPSIDSQQNIGLIQPATAPTVFLSYSTQDRGFARRLAGDLEKHGAEVWWDRQNIDIGDRLAREIFEAIELVENFIVILSPSAVKSSWVQRELNTAVTLEIERGQPTIRPLVLETCDRPSALLSYHYADFTAPSAYMQQLPSLLASVGLAQRQQTQSHPHRGQVESALIAALVRLFPSPPDFRMLARELGFAAPSVVERHGPMDRWAVLVGAAKSQNRLDEVRHAAGAKLPTRRQVELDSMAHEGPDPLIARSRLISIADSLGQPAKPYFGSLLASAPKLQGERGQGRLDLGRLALDRYWSDKLRFARIDSWRFELDQRAESPVFELASKKGLLTNDAGEPFAERDLGLASAADFLTLKAEEDSSVGKELVDWVLPRLAEFPAYSHEIMIYFFSWWSPAVDLTAKYLQDRSRSPAAEPRRRLLELTFAERLQREAEHPLAPGQIERPYAVQYAERAGLEGLIASVLEILGEQHPKIYLDLWRQSRGPARAPLARAAIRHAPVDQPLGIPILDRARQAADAETQPEHILSLVESPTVRRAWFDILPSDPAVSQIEALGELLSSLKRSARAARTRLECAERLTMHPDLVLVWDTLAHRRSTWLERLEPEDLHRPAFNALFKTLSQRLLTVAERRDLELLRERRAAPLNS